MKTLHTTLIVSLSTLAMVTAGTAPARAESFKLADGSVLEGTLQPPAEVIVRTPNGSQRVPYALLPEEAQRVYWSPLSKPAAAPAPAAIPSAPNAAEVEPVAMGPLTDDDLTTLANEVALETWTQIATIGSFRDKPEKRGSAGLVVTKGFNALEENWVTVYSPKDPVGVAKSWEAQVTRARTLQTRATQFIQKRWLEMFIRAGEAVAKKDSAEFASALRELKRNQITAQPGAANGRNFFTAK